MSYKTKQKDRLSTKQRNNSPMFWYHISQTSDAIIIIISVIDLILQYSRIGLCVCLLLTHNNGST